MSRIKSICVICDKEVTGIGNRVQYKHVRHGDIENQQRNIIDTTFTGEIQISLVTA